VELRVPPSVRWAIAEMVLGSNPAIHIYASGYAFAHVAYVLGTDQAEENWQSTWLIKPWGATMMLTEPDAGSDVGAGRTKSSTTTRWNLAHHWYQDDLLPQVMLIFVKTLCTLLWHVRKVAWSRNKRSVIILDS
jgi:hypothetical protein